jgi:hypothetical protein
MLEYCLEKEKKICIVLICVAVPIHFYAAPAPGKNFEVVPASSAPPL